MLVLKLACFIFLLSFASALFKIQIRCCWIFPKFSWRLCFKWHFRFVWSGVLQLVLTILHWVSSSYETIPNAPKHYETHQNMTLGSNGVDWLRLLRKISMWLCGTTFCINCTSSPRFAPSLMQLRNDCKCTQTLRNAQKNGFTVQWVGLGAFVAKNSDTTSWHKHLH